MSSTSTAHPRTADPRRRLAAAAAVTMLSMMTSLIGAAPALAQDIEEDNGETVFTVGTDTDDATSPDAEADEVVGPRACVDLDPSLTTTLGEVDHAVDADRARHDEHVDGSGIDIAVIDTGVMPVSGLAGTTVEGVDLSFDHVTDGLRGMDLHGHGTAMASIAAGRDGYGGDGIAPGARIIDVRVGAANGAVDVSQVIAGIDWVTANKNTGDRNIRVLSLSYNTDSLQPYQLDPIAYAVERAWRAGIVVVVAAGNDGLTGGHLGNPATNPYVIAVGAAERDGTDWEVAEWSANGDGVRNPDVVAPGAAILGAGVQGSYLAEMHPGATCLHDGQLYLRGSGTSQAAAVVAGAAALLVEDRSWLTPDEVKYLLTSTADDLGVAETRQGAGLIDVRDAIEGRSHRWRVRQTHIPATGLGSLELSRGTMHVGDADDRLTGEVTAFGTDWDPASWVDDGGWEVVTTADGTVVGATWSGATWSGATWSGATWSGATWSGATWSGAAWSGATWSGATWSGATWSGATWSGATWSGATWSGSGWSGASWTGASWT